MSEERPGSNKHRLALPAGTMLGKYRLESVLGSGGFGITYLAHDGTLHRKVAIKELLPTDIATRIEGTTVVPRETKLEEDFGWARERFVDEGRTLAACEHPAVVHIYDTFAENGTAYLVTKFVEGRDFETWLKELGRKPTEQELKALAKPILAGLELVHSKGYLHRDIKPENLFISDAGDPILLDFGSARQSISNRSRPMTSIVTPGYAPFEQYYSGNDGEEENQGPWTDLYALAGVMIRAMTGKKPPEAPGRVQSSRSKKAQPLSMREELAGEYSDGFLEAVDQAFAVDPEDRPQSVAEWREVLVAKSVEQEQEQEREPGFDTEGKLEREGESRRHEPDETEDGAPAMKKKRGKLLAGIAALVLLMAGGAGIMAWLKGDSVHQEYSDQAWKLILDSAPAEESIEDVVNALKRSIDTFEALESDEHESRVSELIGEAGAMIAEHREDYGGIRTELEALLARAPVEGISPVAEVMAELDARVSDLNGEEDRLEGLAGQFAALRKDPNTDKDALRIALVDMQQCVTSFWRTEVEVAALNDRNAEAQTELDGLRQAYESVNREMAALRMEVEDASLSEQRRKEAMEKLEDLASDQQSNAEIYNARQRELTEQVQGIRKSMEDRIVADLKAALRDVVRRHPSDLTLDLSYFPKSNKWIKFVSSRVPDLTGHLRNESNADAPADHEFDRAVSEIPPVSLLVLRIGVIDAQECLNRYWRTPVEVEKVNALAARRKTELSEFDSELKEIQDRLMEARKAVEAAPGSRLATENWQSINSEHVAKQNARKEMVSEIQEEIAEARQEMESILVSEVTDGLAREAEKLSFDLVFDSSFLPKGDKILVFVSEAIPNLTDTVMFPLNTQNPSGEPVEDPSVLNENSGDGVKPGVVDMQACLESYWKYEKGWKNGEEAGASAEAQQQARKDWESGLRSDIRDAVALSAEEAGLDLVIDRSYLPDGNKAVVDVSGRLPDLTESVVETLDRSRQP